MQVEKDKLYVNIFLVAFWIRVSFSFLCEEISPALETLESFVFLLSDVILIAIGLYSLRKKWDIIFALAFIVAGYWVTCVHNQYSFSFYINGLRDFIYILFLLPLFRYVYQSQSRCQIFCKSLDKNLYVFLWVQFVCILYQFFKYGANDYGGGSMGLGFTGMVSTLIYIISFYLMKKRILQDDKGYFRNLVKNKDLIFLLIPTFLNETKISFIYLVLYFLLLLPFDRKLIMRLLIACPILAVLVCVAYWGYIKATGNTGDITSLQYYTEMYLIAEDTDTSLDWAEYLYETDEAALDDLPRITKMVLIPDLNREYPGHDITGYGIGQFKGGTTLTATKFYSDNEWFLRGSVPYLFHLYIQFGLIGLGFFVWSLIRLFAFRRQGVKHDKGIIAVIYIILLVTMIYNDALRFAFMCIPLFYILLQSQMGSLSLKGKSLSDGAAE